MPTFSWSGREYPDESYHGPIDLFQFVIVWLRSVHNTESQVSRRPTPLSRGLAKISCRQSSSLKEWKSLANRYLVRFRLCGRVLTITPFHSEVTVWSLKFQVEKGLLHAKDIVSIIVGGVGFLITNSEDALLQQYLNGRRKEIRTREPLFFNGTLIIRSYLDQFKYGESGWVDLTPVFPDTCSCRCPSGAARGTHGISNWRTACCIYRN